MTNREPIEATNLDTIYGSETIPWSRARDLLAIGAFPQTREEVQRHRRP